MEIEKYKCACNKEFTEKEFEKHFSNCILFKKQYKNLDNSLADVFKKYFISPETKKIGIFLLKLYIKVIEKKLNKNKNNNSVNEFKNDTDKNIANNNSNDTVNLKLSKIIENKDKEIEELKIKLNNTSLEKINPGEKIIAVNFISADTIVNYCVPCKNIDIFVKIEEKLYDEYPEYKDKETYFICGGNKIKRFRTLEENKITNNSKIMIFFYEE